MLIAKGRPSNLDLWQFVTTPSEITAGIDMEAAPRPTWSFLSLSWGVISDVDIESEAVRCFGALRFTLWAVWRVITLRQYAASLHYQDAQSGEWQTMTATDFLGLCACSTFLKATNTRLPCFARLSRLSYPNEAHRLARCFAGACNVPYMSSTDFAAPDARFDNGALDVLVIRGVGRLQMLSLFLKLEDGKHVDCQGVTMLRVKALRLEPQPRTARHPGILDVDGEVVPFGSITAQAYPSAMRVLTL
jgi:sphingosine kinase